jgi:hypothetical protein
MQGRTSDVPDIMLTDRTTIETDWECGRKRWWYKEAEGGGIVPASPAPYFLHGANIHKRLDRAAIEEPMPSIEWPTTVEKREIMCREVGWDVAFRRWILPSLLDGHEVVATEHEVVLERGDLWIAATPDLILRRLKDGKLIVIDYKTVGLLGRSWTLYWPYAIQMHILIKAVEEEYQTPVAYAQVVGLVKGREEGPLLRHPYTYAYTPMEGGAWDAKWHRDWMLRLVDEREGGVEKWVIDQGEEVGRGLFPFSAPIFLNERLLDSLVHDRHKRESDLTKVRHLCQTEPLVRAQYFEQRFSKCRAAFGSECGYLAACHNATVEADPLGSGLYIKRTPHHDLETLMRGDDDGMEQ